MKTIFLFEGIASSGKTTLEKLLAARLKDVEIVTEGQTLMPIIDNKDGVAARVYLEEQLKTIAESDAENVIVDRFHLTHAFRTSSSLESFSDIEMQLQRLGKVLLVFLTIDPAHIRERIEETLLLRKDGWKKGAQGSLDEKSVYYTKQQEMLRSLVSQSHLPSITIDTTEKVWNEYIEEILARVIRSVDLT